MATSRFRCGQGPRSCSTRNRMLSRPAVIQDAGRFAWRTEDRSTPGTRTCTPDELAKELAGRKRDTQAMGGAGGAARTSLSLRFQIARCSVRTIKDKSQLNTDDAGTQPRVRTESYIRSTSSTMRVKKESH